MLGLPAAPAVASATHAPGVTARPSFQAVLQARGVGQEAAPRGGVFGERTLQAAKQIERAQERLDAILAAARSGQTFSAQQLLALQSEAYRYGQTVEIAAKVVEQGAQSIKQAVNTQV